MFWIDECDTASEINKSVNLFHAIRWWLRPGRIKETISKCFRKAGILNKELAVVTSRYEDEDPFDDLDNSDTTSGKLEDLVHQVIPAEERCSFSENINGKNDLSVC